MAAATEARLQSCAGIAHSSHEFAKEQELGGAAA
jgi:hypothetical protein